MTTMTSVLFQCFDELYQSDQDTKGFKFFFEFQKNVNKNCPNIYINAVIWLVCAMHIGVKNLKKLHILLLISSLNVSG